MLAKMTLENFLSFRKKSKDIKPAAAELGHAVDSIQTDIPIIHAARKWMTHLRHWTVENLTLTSWV